MLVQSVTIPQMVREQHFERPIIKDVEGKLRTELEKPEIRDMDFFGKRIAITNAVTQLPKIPVTIDSDPNAIAAAITTCIFADDRENIKLIRIKNTMELGEIWVSEALLEEVKKNPLLEALSKPEPFAFDEAGNLF